ncbi:hypothetical protein [Reinekea sp.]|jgi:hypothetical protein|uniref:hypothetical protein n=1 Tax=Reinekea sp. TaxID=1970455 RepID=UPI00398A4036
MTDRVAKCAMFVFIMALSPWVLSQTEWAAGISAQVNSGDPVQSQLSPDVSFKYLHPRFTVQSSASTVFASQSDFIPDTWQSQNQLTWSLPAELITGGLSYGHQETDRLDTGLLTVADSASANVSVTIPQSRTLQHQLSALTQYREVKQFPEDGSENSQVSDRSEQYNYRLLLSTSPRVSWQGGAGLQFSDSGQRVASINLNRNFQTPRYSIALSSAVNQTEINDSTTESLTGSAAYNYTHNRFMLSTSISRSITDTLDLFEIAGLETTFEQQQYVEADQLNIGLSNIKPTDSLNMSVSYAIGKTQSLTEVADFSQNIAITYKQWNVQTIFSFSASTQLSLQFMDRVEEESHSQSLSAGIQKIFSTHWAATATIRDDLLTSSPLSWTVAASYRL